MSSSEGTEFNEQCGGEIDLRDSHTTTGWIVVFNCEETLRSAAVYLGESKNAQVF